MRLRHGAAVLLLVGVFATPARADIIVFDPNAYALGTDVSDLLPGLSMSVVAGRWFSEAVYSPMLISNGYGSAFGSLDLGNTHSAEDLVGCAPGMTSAAPGCGGSYRLQDFRFDAPTNLVQMSAAAGADGFMMVAYNAAGHQLAGCGFLWGSTFGQAGCANLLAPFSTTAGNHGLLTVQREQGDISRVLFGGLFGSGAVTGVRYSVPEPSTLAAILIGAVGFQFRRRRRPKATRA